MNNLDRIVEVILNSKRFLVTSHENPDGDAIGSMLALGLALQSLDKEVVLFNTDGVPKVLDFLQGSALVCNSVTKLRGKFDCCLIVDCTDISRVGSDFKEFVESGRCGTTIIIDHHHTNRKSADIYLLSPDSSSTGMIIHNLIKKLDIQINPDIATNLYTTIIGDTGSFRYSNTYPETFRVAAELVEFGANPSDISQSLYESEKPERLKLIGLVLPTLEVTQGGRIASVVLKKEMFSKTGTTSEDADGIVNFPRSIRGVEVAILFSELEKINKDESLWKISLRSKGQVDVATVAEKFCGGGHKKSAGCIVKGSLIKVKQEMYNFLKSSIV